MGAVALCLSFPHEAASTELLWHQKVSPHALERFVDDGTYLATSNSTGDPIGLICPKPFFPGYVTLVDGTHNEQCRNLILGWAGIAIPIYQIERLVAPEFERLSGSRNDNFPIFKLLRFKPFPNAFHIALGNSWCVFEFEEKTVVLGDRLPMVLHMNVKVTSQGTALTLKQTWFNINRQPWALRCASYVVSIPHRLGSIASILHGLSGELDLPEKPKSSQSSDKRGNSRPPCSFASGVCGLPLSAKVALTVITALIAWPLYDRALDYFDGLGGRLRNRWRALAYLTLSLGVFAGFFAAILWGSTD